MQPGLRRVAPGSAQLTPNRIGARALREKLAVLSAHWRKALLQAPGFDAQPRCTHWLRKRYASIRRRCPSTPKALGMRTGSAGRCAARSRSATRTTARRRFGDRLRALPPEWRRAALLSLAFAEDFAVIDGRSACIPWLAVCLPSGWAPEDKVGHHFAAVHAPVADNHTLLTAADHLARLVTGGEAWERFVWTVTRHPRLHAHPDHVDPAPWPAEREADAAALAGARVLPHRAPDLHPVAGAGAPRPPWRCSRSTSKCSRWRRRSRHHSTPRQLHDALASMSDAVLDYRGLTPARERLLDWLAHV